MDFYIYIYTYICKYIYIHTYVNIYIYIFLHIHTHTYIYMHICTYVYIYILKVLYYIYIYLHVCMCSSCLFYEDVSWEWDIQALQGSFITVPVSQHHLTLVQEVECVRSPADGRWHQCHASSAGFNLSCGFWHLLSLVQIMKITLMKHILTTTGLGWYWQSQSEPLWPLCSRSSEMTWASITAVYWKNPLKLPSRDFPF